MTDFIDPSEHIFVIGRAGYDSVTDDNRRAVQTRMYKAIHEGNAPEFISAAKDMDSFTGLNRPDSWAMVIGGENNAFSERVVMSIVSRTHFLPGHVGMLQELMRRGMDLNETKDASGMQFRDTALTATLRKGSASMARALLELGADPNLGMELNATKKSTLTPLSCLLGHVRLQPLVPGVEKPEVTEKLKALLDAGATFSNMTKGTGMTPLEIAVKSDWNTVQALLEIGEDPHQRFLQVEKNAFEATEVSRPDLHANMLAWVSSRNASKAIDGMLSIARQGARP